MPAISMFYGIIVYMYYVDTARHHKPHIHAKYQNFKVAVSIPEGEVLTGNFPPSKMKLLQAWIELRQEELLADWQLAVNGEKPFEIKPL